MAAINTTETAVVEKPAEEEEHGHGLRFIRCTQNEAAGAVAQPRLRATVM